LIRFSEKSFIIYNPCKSETILVKPFKPQRGEINIARGNAPGNPIYAFLLRTIIKYLSLTL